MRNFKEWFECFRQSINGYDFYVDFEKVYGKVDNIKIELNILNSLIGSKNIEEEFSCLLKKYPEVIKVIPILLAKREREIYCQDENGGKTYLFNNGNIVFNNSTAIEENKYFMRKTGLFDLLSSHIINNLVDYVLGVEVGLDTHARKSRGGDSMEDLVESFLQKEGLKKGEQYFKEMKLSTIQEKWGLNLSTLSNNGKTEKRFDFVIKTDKTIYGVETNFYSTQGSKLNETARSYKMLAQEAKAIKGFAFVWVTDGMGWKFAKNNLEETFDVLDYIYNIFDLENGIIKELIKN